MGGKPCIRVTRVTVGMIVGLVASGQTKEGILTYTKSNGYVVLRNVRNAVGDISESTKAGACSSVPAFFP